MFNDLTGAIPALITPFKDNKVDPDALVRLVNHCIEGGVSALIPCGTTGESFNLNDEEHAFVVKTVLEAAKQRVPVFSGIGTASTRHTIHLAKQDAALGVDGFLIVSPYYNRPTQDGLVAHHKAIAEAVPLPSILYNIPGRTGVDTSLETLERLADEPSIFAIKEATGNVIRAGQILSKFGNRYSVFSGDDVLTLSMMALGAKGVISVTANVLPKETSSVVALFLEKKMDEAVLLNRKLAPIHEAMFIESNPGPIKWLAHQRGFGSTEIRLPLVWPSTSTQEKIKQVWKQQNISL